MGGDIEKRGRERKGKGGKDRKKTKRGRRMGDDMKIRKGKK